VSLLGDRILEELGPEIPFYAVLDCAQRGGVAAWATGTKAPVWILYEGEMEKDLEEVAPRLVRMGRGHAFTDDFLAEGFQGNWGILISSEANSKELRRHLRRFFLARTEDDRRLLFRYYDPRVLSAYLPALNPAELKIFFGPIKMFIAPDVDGGDPLVFQTFRLRGTELIIRRVVVDPPALPEQAAAGS
jgi:hypothetical protein